VNTVSIADPNEWPRNDFHVERLLSRLTKAFSVTAVPDSLNVVLSGIGDDHGRLRVLHALSKPWAEVTIDDIRRCGPDLLFHISASGLLYYLPAFLSNLLRLREFGWFEEALIPGVPGYDDVVDYFSDGVLCGERSESAQRYLFRVNFLKDRLTADQRECVAQYIEVAESYGVRNLSEERIELLTKFAGFWRS